MRSAIALCAGSHHRRSAACAWASAHPSRSSPHDRGTPLGHEVIVDRLVRVPLLKPPPGPGRLRSPRWLRSPRSCTAPLPIELVATSVQPVGSVSRRIPRSGLRRGRPSLKARPPGGVGEDPDDVGAALDLLVCRYTPPTRGRSGAV